MHTLDALCNTEWGTGMHHPLYVDIEDVVYPLYLSVTHTEGPYGVLHHHLDPYIHGSPDLTTLRSRDPRWHQILAPDLVQILTPFGDTFLVPLWSRFWSSFWSPFCMLSTPTGYLVHTHPNT